MSCINPCYLKTLFAALWVLSSASVIAADPFSNRSGEHFQALAAKLRAGEKVRVMAKLNSTPVSGPAAAVPAAAFTQACRGLENRGLRIGRELPRLGVVTLELEHDELDALLDSGLVEQVMEDVPEAPLLQQSIVHIRADEAHAEGFIGSGQAVVVLDTGIEYWHSFFTNRVVEEACFSTNDPAFGIKSLCPNGSDRQVGAGAAQDCSATGISGCDHGTHVAGIAAGSGSGITGVAPDADIVAVQVFSEFPASAPECGGRKCILSFPSDQLAALQWVLNEATTGGIAAINISIGGGLRNSTCDSDFRAPVIRDLRQAGIATVIASGNDGGTGVSVPGCISAAVTVGSTRDNRDLISSFSNRSALVDLMAPGSAITSSVVGGGFGTKWGTSMAAPHVTGAFAVMRSVHAGVSVNYFEKLLQDSGVGIFDAQSYLTYPRLELYSAVQAALPLNPVASLDRPMYSVPVNSVGEFTASTSVDPAGLPLTYTWQFGDGTAAVQTAGAQTAHTYSTTGTFRLLLSVDNGARLSDPDAAADVTVYDPHIVNIIVTSVLL